MNEDIQPSPKSETIDELITKVIGKDRRATILSGLCMTCERKADHFRDALSRKEYSISGCCQYCQNLIFGTETEYEGREEEDWL